MNYRECNIQFVERCERLAAETGAPLELVIKVQKSGWADEVALAREQTASKAELDADRNAALTRLPEVLAPFRANGRWPRAKDIIAPLGLRQTRSNLGWVAYQLRLAAPTAQAAE
jgi:hypothetical protein